jgi:hypothetical protein
MVKLKRGQLPCVFRNDGFLLFTLLLQSNAPSVSYISSSPFQLRVGELLSPKMSLNSFKEMSKMYSRSSMYST